MKTGPWLLLFAGMCTLVNEYLITFLTNISSIGQQNSTCVCETVTTVQLLLSADIPLKSLLLSPSGSFPPPERVSCFTKMSQSQSPSGATSAA